MRVPMFDMQAELAPLRADLDAALARVLDSGTFIGGEEVTSFERELAPAMHAAHAIGTSSGSDALHVLFMALGIRPGDEVVTTPLTFFATAGGAARLGARIVFADVAEDTLTLDPRAAIAACSSRTRAIVPVNLYGLYAELPAAPPCPIIEDAAHTIGLPLRGHAAALSFFPTKNLGAFGDAGAVITNDAALADRVQLLRSHGGRPKYVNQAIGGNFRLDTLQAAVLRTKLPHLHRATEARRANAAHYRALFAAAKLPPELRVPPPIEPHVYHQFVIRTPRRDALRAHLAAAGISTEVYYPHPLHLVPAFADLGYRTGSLPVAERACTDVLALPIYPSLREDAREFIVEQIATFYQC